MSITIKKKKVLQHALFNALSTGGEAPSLHDT